MLPKSKDIEIQLISTKPTLKHSTSLPKPKIFATIYNPEQIPPNFPLAINHGKAYKLFKAHQIEDTLDDSSLCPCCHLPLEGSPLPLTCDLESFFHTGTHPLGSGYALYFTFIKYSAIVVLILLAGSGAYNLFTNMVEGGCGYFYCDGGFGTFLSLANKRDDKVLIDIQLYFNLFTLIAIMMFFQLFRYKLRKVAVQGDDTTLSPADYTLKLTRIPLSITDDDIQNWFEAFSSSKFPVRCVKIVRTFDIKELFSLEKKKEELAMNYNNKAGQDNQDILRQELVEIKEHILNKLHRKEFCQTPTVFVTFETPMMVKFLLKMLKPEGLKNFFSRINPFSQQLLMMKGHKIDFIKAPDPSDVMWENLGSAKREKIKHRIFTNVCTLLVLGLGCGLIIGISLGRRYVKNHLDGDSTFTLILSLIGSLLIVIVNLILSAQIKRFTQSERHSTRTGYATAIARKEAIALLINTAFTSFIVEILMTETLSIEINPLYQIHIFNIYGEGGLIANMFFIFLIDGFSNPLFNILDPEYFYKYIMRKKALKQGKTAAMTQGSANLLFEAPQPNIATKYAFLIKTILLTAFYAPALPVCIIISILVIFLIYWSDKYLFLRRNPLPPALDSQLSNSMISYLEWMPFTFAIGNIIFMSTLVQSDGGLAYDNENKPVILATIFMSLLSILIPTKTLNSFLFKLKGEIKENIPYDEANFSTDFETENPITRHKALDNLPYKFY